MILPFEVRARDPDSAARRGILFTAHGQVDTPAFMPVGTRASVTGMTVRDLGELGVQMVLANTYHLLLRPGPELFRRVGGIHGFMRFGGPVLTDSGGYQIFSLADDRTITEEGARFRSYVDQQTRMLSPEESIAMQLAIGADIMMVLDVCVPSQCDHATARAAMERTHRWALRSLAARDSAENALFAIAQGGLFPELRRESATTLSDAPFDGFAIGGLAVGDTRAQREDTIALCAEHLPRERPRYLMGVGTPAELVSAVRAGVDLFDCMLPTYMARQGAAFTSSGRVRITRTAYASADGPLDAACSCSTCHSSSRAYLHHLFKCTEPLGPRLLSYHNLHYYQQLMRDTRTAIEHGRYDTFARDTLSAIDRHEHNGRKPGSR
jgi:queuine tRNA-ribosyltransferase